MMKKFLSLFFLLTCALAAVAMPAKPGWHTVKQSDGTTLQVQAVGNAFNHALLTSVHLVVDGTYHRAGP